MTTGTIARNAARYILWCILGGLLTACATEPQTRVLHSDTFEIVASDDNQNVQKKANVIIEDQGEVKEIVRPVRVQACDGAHLRWDEQQYVDTKGRTRVR